MDAKRWLPSLGAYIFASIFLSIVLSLLSFSFFGAVCFSLLLPSPLLFLRARPRTDEEKAERALSCCAYWDVKKRKLTPRERIGALITGGIPSLLYLAIGIAATQAQAYGYSGLYLILIFFMIIPLYCSVSAVIEQFKKIGWGGLSYPLGVGVECLMIFAEVEFFRRGSDMMFLLFLGTFAVVYYANYQERANHLAKKDECVRLLRAGVELKRFYLEQPTTPAKPTPSAKPTTPAKPNHTPFVMPVDHRPAPPN